MNYNRDIWLFVALAIAWGTSFAAIEVGLSSLPAILFAALRFDLAAALFAGAVVAIGADWRPRTGADWTLIGVGATLVIGAHFALLFVGQSYVSSGVAAIVLSLTPIVTPPLALAVLPRERIRAPAAVGLLLGLAGVVVIAVPGGSLDGQAIGVALLLGSATAFAIGSVLTERVRGTLPLVSLQAWSMAGGAAILHALSAVHPGESVAAVEPSIEALAALAYLSIVATGGGFFAYFFLLERIGATEISLVNYAVPVVAAGFGWLALGEAITATTVLGFGLILLGFALCKIGALWKTAAPVVGYGPQRLSTSAEGIVVKGNVYVTRSANGGEAGSRSVVQSAD